MTSPKTDQLLIKIAMTIALLALVGYAIMVGVTGSF